jgi:hypothetical protein
MIPANDQSSLYAVVSTTKDIQALSDLLRFKQNWGSGHRSQISHGGYVEHIEQTWSSLALHGPAAGRSLATAFPLTPKLTALSLHDTTITTEEFPFDLLPAGLCRVSINNMPISASFLRRLSQHTALEQLSLTAVAVDGLDLSEQSDAPADDTAIELLLPGLRTLYIENTPVSESLMRILSQHTALKELWLSDVDREGVDPAEPAIGHGTTVEWMRMADVRFDHIGDETRPYVELRGPAAGGWLAKLLPLMPDMSVLELREIPIRAEAFPYDLVPPGLRRLHIANAQINESFFRGLSPHTALEDLWLREVAVEGVDLTDLAFGHFTTLRTMHLTDVTVDGVDLTDLALEPLTARLREQLPRTWVSISSSTSDKQIEWSTPYPIGHSLRMSRTENSD